MEDEKIIELYFSRNEFAISESAEKYGNYCFGIANGILASSQDAEECVSDTWMKAWNSIPPNRPNVLKLFFGRITRNSAIEKYRKNKAKKRGSGQINAILEELSEVIPSDNDGGEMENVVMLSDSINRFLANAQPRERTIFLRRYFWGESVSDIAFSMGLGRSYTGVILSRVRKSLKTHLESEGYTI